MAFLLSLSSSSSAQALHWLSSCRGVAAAAAAVVVDGPARPSLLVASLDVATSGGQPDDTPGLLQAQPSPPNSDAIVVVNLSGPVPAGDSVQCDLHDPHAHVHAHDHNHSHAGSGALHGHSHGLGLDDVADKKADGSSVKAGTMFLRAGWWGGRTRGLMWLYVCEFVRDVYVAGHVDVENVVLLHSPSPHESPPPPAHSSWLHLGLRCCCYLRAVIMDFAIAVHSVIIGVALGVNVDIPAIRVLLVACVLRAVCTRTCMCVWGGGMACGELVWSGAELTRLRVP
jgi:hypothetical protein